jgi:SAM-dependent methyltransferase
MFYNRPWDSPSPPNVVATVVTIEDTNMTEGPPTARQATFDKAAQKPKTQQYEDDDLYGSGNEANKPSPKVQVNFEYDEKYYTELNQTAGQNLDRTGSWLAAQTGYLSAILDSDPNLDLDDRATLVNMGTIKITSPDKTQAETAVAAAVNAPENNSPESPPEAKEPIFLTAFQYLLCNRKRRDAFIHASSRLEAIQATRVAMPEKHITNLLGQHVLVEPARPKYAGPFSQNPRATGIFDQTAEQIAYKTAEREQLALASIEPSNWQIDALRAMFNGRLLASEAACQRLKTRANIPLDDPTCIGKRRIRILDIGGTACASWAWNAALEWPNVKVYTVISKDQSQSQRPSGTMKPEAPPNHRTVSVPHLWQLPFRGGHFDVISTRSLHVLLKNNPVPGVPEIDEWDLTLRECLRVLKPGGFIDYMIMDSTIAHAGPRGETMSVEFGFELHRRGYEREAARNWLRRLKKVGFVGVKRAWVFMPMGRKPPKEAEEHIHGYTGGWQSWRQGAKPFVPAPRPISEVSTISKIVKQYMDVEAVQGPVGSTEDVADLTGLLGARMWEEWLVKVRAESGREPSRWLEGADEVIEEGKEKGSGWKALVGWARKPRPEKNEKPVRAEITVAVEDMGELTSTSPVSPSPLGDEPLETGMIPMVIQE